jgi:hypothetical protein
LETGGLSEADIQQFVAGLDNGFVEKGVERAFQVEVATDPYLTYDTGLLENLIGLYAEGNIPIYDPIFFLDLQDGSLSACFTVETTSASLAVEIGAAAFLKSLQLLGLDVTILSHVGARVQPLEEEEEDEEDEEGGF